MMTGRLGTWIAVVLCVGLVGLSLSPRQPTLAPARAGSAGGESPPPSTSTTTTAPAPTTTTIAAGSSLGAGGSSNPAASSSGSPAAAPAQSAVPPGFVPPLPYQLASTGGASQLLIIDAPSWGSTYATATAWQLEAGVWTEVMGPMAAWTGYGGWRYPSSRYEGDGSTPIGMYSIGSTMYGINPNPGVSYAYHQLVPGDYWDENPSSPTYNSFQSSPVIAGPGCSGNPFGGDTECLWQESFAYQYFAVIGFNPAPTSNPIGSGVFLHVGAGGSTAGCVSLSDSNLVSVLRWLNPSASPLIIEAPDDVLRDY
jgi:L,D-peptidoglycan transpeptidase YkuD (ErfK/YbiS/YcfS/YnhG family)